MFPTAAQPDMVRALQKDEYYLANLQENCHEIASNILGNFKQADPCQFGLTPCVIGRRSVHWKAEIDAVAGIVYHGLTAGSG